MIKDIVKSALKVIVVCLIFFFLGKTLYHNWNQIDFQKVHFNYFFLLVSIFALGIYFFLLSFGWVIILRKLNVVIPCLTGFKIVFYASLGKYLPGKIWMAAGQIYLAQKIGISKTISFISFVFEAVLTMISGSLIFLIALLFNPEFNFKISPIYLIIITILLLAIIHPKFLEKILNFLIVKFKKEPITINLTFVQLLNILGYYCLVWFFLGFAFYFLINSLTFISMSKIPILTGSFAIAGIMGLLALFAPGGLGVREGVLAYLLSNFFPVSMAILISIVCRLWVTLVELIMVGIATRIKT